MTKQIKNQFGFTLVEVLVAVIILSVGLLGVAAMQTKSLKGGSSALHRTQATLAAEDILDRMRVNRQAAIDGEYDLALDDVAPTAPFATLALEDLAQWRESLTNNLPDGNGSVTVDSNIATVVVTWRDSLADDSIEVVTRL